MADPQLKIILKLKDEATAKLKGFNKSLIDFRKQSASSFAAAKKGLSAIRKPALVATAALTGVAAASFKLAESAGKYESIRDAFRSMTEGMGVGVEDFERKVAEASAGTLDKLTILRGGTRALSLMGREAFSDFGTEFAKMAEYAKKAARATGYETTYMFDSLITGMSRESKLILDNLGITVDLVKAKEDYAAQLGKEVDELTAVEEKQAVLNHTMGKLEETYGKVAVSSGGMSGAMSKMKATITDAKLEIGLALIPVFNDLVRTITPLIKKHVPELIEKVKKLVEWFKNLSPEARKVLLIFLAIAPAIVAISTALMPVLTVMQALIPVVGALAAALGIGSGSLLAILGLVAAAIGSVVTAGYLLMKNWEDVKLFFRITWREIKDIFRDAIDAIMKKMQPLLDVVERVKGSIQGIIEKIPEIRVPEIKMPEIKVPELGVPSWLHFQGGGVVPGRIGQPMPAIVHGGEMIVPPDRKVGNNFYFNFEGAFIGDVEAFKRRIIEAINRESELKAIGGE